MAFFSKAAAAVAGFSAGVALAEKIGGIVSPTTQAFNKIKFGDVSGAASAAGLKPITKFKPNDFPTLPSKFATDATKLALSQPDKFTVLTYPEDIGKYFIKLSFISYKKAEPLSIAEDNPTLVVVLPIPSNLNDNFSVSYNDAKLGAVMGSLVETGRNVIEGKQDLLSKETGKTLIGAAAVGVRGEVAKLGGETLIANIDKATGAVPNPHLAAIFQDIGLREHNFSFRFSPKNSKESQVLKSVIFNIKKRILPGTAGGDSKTGPLFTFPDVVDISFGPSEDVPYMFERCVVTSFGVNYSPNGTPSFFKDGNPTDIEMNIAFKEIRVITRDSLKKQQESDFINTQKQYSQTFNAI
ncbi:hypothetical protein EB118_22895 [bacterium]|nr:hypothetical protein [bacterium]